MSSNRRPTAAKAARPIDKQSINFNKTVGTTQLALAVRTAAMAETFSGAKITGGWAKSTATILGNVTIVLVLVRDGQTASTLDLGDGNCIYEPEQDILWAKAIVTLAAAGTSFNDIEGTVGTMRKLKAGDSLQLLAVGTTPNLVSINLVFTGFYKQ